MHKIRNLFFFFFKVFKNVLLKVNLATLNNDKLLKNLALRAFDHVVLPWPIQPSLKK